MNIHLKTTLRNLRKKPVYSLITFVGFTFGIAAGLLIYLWVFNELNYDKSHQNYERIYRVLTLSKQGNEIVKSPKCYRPIAATLKRDYPQIEYATYLSYSSEDSPLQCEDGGEKIEARSLWVNNDFFSIFNGFVFVEGEAFNAIKNPSGIILSEKVAKKLFGDKPALGQTVISDKYSKEVYTVEGVVSIPKNSHIDFGYILPECNPKVASYADKWGDSGHTLVYLKLRKDAQIDNALLARLQNHISRYSSKTDKLLFQPLTDIHLKSDYEPSTYDKNISSYKYVWIFSGLALLIILMATFNFSVLSVARASERSTEIGIKKANGASRFHIIRQFMGESLIQTIAAMLLAFFVVWLLLPWLSNLLGKELQFDFSMKLFVNLLLIALLSGLLAGAYPSLFLSSFNPSAIFRGGTNSGSKTGFIRILVAVQFSFAIFFIAATLLLVKQLDYIRTKDIGLNHQDIVVIPTGLWYDNKGFKEELMKNPNILGVSASVNAPVDFQWETTLSFNHQGITDSLKVARFWVDEDFAKTYQLKLIKGQFLQMDNGTYWKEKEKEWKSKQDGKEYKVSIPIVINETAEKQFGFADPIGQRIGSNVIVGVVKDFNIRTLYHQIIPVILENNPETIGTMSVKISPANRAATLKFIRNVYGKYRDQRNLSYSFFDDLMNEKYKDETILKNVTIAFSILAIVISILGILGMAVFSISLRIKEIGIRKINGAKVSEVISMLNLDFVKWVAIAFVIATPIAYYVMNKWLENFAYKTSLSWWIFALSGILALGIALLTVSWQSWKVATRNPVEALRYE